MLAGLAWLAAFAFVFHRFLLALDDGTEFWVVNGLFILMWVCIGGLIDAVMAEISGGYTGLGDSLRGQLRRLVPRGRRRRW